MTLSDGTKSMLSTARSALRSVANPDPLAQLTGEGGLLDFIPRISPHFQAPLHLRPLVVALERAQREPVRIVCHAPPRHGKTETVLHAMVWYLLQDPRLRIGYVTYGAKLSLSKSRACRDIAHRAGIELARDANALGDWRTTHGGGLLATGIGGGFTGEGVHRLFIDDPYKNRPEAESAARREFILDWWRDVARTRLEPGASAVVFCTRWTPDDLSGFLIKQGWDYIRIPALADGGGDIDPLDTREVGEPLWPDRYPTERLAELRRDVGEYTWGSLFQGVPRGRGNAVFKTEAVRRYTADALREVLKDPRGFRRGIGADFAYTKKTSADYSALVAGLGFVLDRKRYLYIREAKRMQQEPPKVAVAGKGMQDRHGKCPALAYVSTTERGVAALMAGYGFRCEGALARGDKFTRAQPYAASWNDGRVLLPEEAPEDPESPGRPDNWFTDWVDTFLAEHVAFTGDEGAEDDQVDASAALHDLLARQPLGGTPAPPPIRTRDINSASPLA